MSKMTITAFRKLKTVDEFKKLTLPLTLTSGKIDLFTFPAATTAQSTTNGATNDQMLKILLGNDTDPVHIADAQRRIDAVISKPAPVPANPNPATPVVPSPAATATGRINGTVTKPYWLGKEWIDNVRDFVKGVCNATNDIPLFVGYNIVNRDSGNYSSGGASDATDYANWTAGIASGIGTKKAILILEPDALGLSRNLPTQTQKDERYNMMNAAIRTLKAACPNILIYVDISIWAGIDDSAALLGKIYGMDGFCDNVSGYMALKDCLAYSEGVANKTGLHYIIDTSRNGNGAPHGSDIWCNQTDTKVGLPNTLQPSVSCDAYLWIKVPGESDGKKINGKDGDGKAELAPAAGTPWAEFKDAIYSGDWTAFNKKYPVR